MKTFGITLCTLLAMAIALPVMAAPTGTVYGNGGQTTSSS